MNHLKKFNESKAELSHEYLKNIFGKYDGFDIIYVKAIEGNHYYIIFKPMNIYTECYDIDKCIDRISEVSEFYKDVKDRISYVTDEFSCYYEFEVYETEVTLKFYV